MTYEDNIEPGTAKALITGTGKYKDSIRESFEILEKKEQPGWHEIDGIWYYFSESGRFGNREKTKSF